MVQPPQDPSGGSEQPLSQEDIDAALNEAGLNTPAPAAQSPAAVPAQPSPAAKPQVDQAGRPFDEFAAAMAEAISAETRSSGPSARAPADGTAAVDLPDFAGGNGKATTLELDKLQMLEDVQLQVRIELGRTRMLVQDVLRLDQGSVVELDKLAGDPVDIYVNERLVARGEVLVLNDNFCVRVNEIVSAPQESMA
jgi:flagellar motor switch protein FliN/FliY